MKYTLHTTFTVETERKLVIHVWTSVASILISRPAIVPITPGWLTSFFSWLRKA